MADFAAVLRKTIAALRENRPEARDRIYQKARTTIEAKLRAVSPPPSAQIIERQMGLLEEAIKTVEAEFSGPQISPEPESDFDQVLSELEAVTKSPASAQWALADTKRNAPVVLTEQTAGKVESTTISEPKAEAPADTAEDVRAEDKPSADDVFTPADPVIIATPRPYGSSEPVASSTEEPVVADVPPGDEVSGDTEPRDEPDSRADDGEALDETFEDRPALRELRSKKAAGPKSRKLPLVAAIVLLLGVGGAAAWFYRDDVATQLASLGASTDVDEPAASGDSPPRVEPAAAQSQAPEPAPAVQESTPALAEEPVRKLTQRLLPDGSEVDEGPASGQSSSIGEGTSVAASTEGPSAATAEASQPTNDAAVAVGQKAIFYEERTIQEQASATNGGVVWTVEQESPGADLPPEPVIYADATIPEKRLRLKMSIRRNVDQSLPASYIAELIFITPEDFAGGGVDSVASVSLKRTEQDAGTRLLGIPAKIADGFFLVALSDNKADMETNNLLLERMEWIDIPIVYSSGRRALITLEKGVPGGSVFNEALATWKQATSG